MHIEAPLTPILVSACLLGLPTRYDGKAKRSQAVLDYLDKEQLLPVPVCPEQLSGMSTPRNRTYFDSGDGQAVLSGDGQVVSETGRPMNAIFCRGAHITLQLARLTGCRRALLKERSPSCGVHQIYRGEQLMAGAGVTTALLTENGIEVISEEDL
jgi:uncharacterized protein YbbK (DUF523 family)